MAEIVFKGKVERLLGSKGIKVVELHSKKNADGEWETVGRTFFTVWVNDLGQPPVDSIVQIAGKQKTVAEEYQGETRYNLHVSATSISIVPTSTSVAAPAPIVDEETPF